MLVAGRFDREHIFRAALGNGASMAEYRGQGLLVVEPFARERQEMNASRWMAILDDRTDDLRVSGVGSAGTGSVFEWCRSGSNAGGASAPTPSRREFVECAADVWADAYPARRSRAVACPLDPHSRRRRRTDGGNSLRFDRSDRFCRTRDEQPDHIIPGRLAAAPRVIPVDLSTSMQTQLRTLSVERGRVRGSFLVPGEQFDRWLASVYTRRPSASSPQPRP